MNCGTVFKQLKYALVDASILVIPNFNANFMVKIDESDVAIGAVLMKHYWPVAFILKVLNYEQYNYYTINNELLAFVLSCKRWFSYVDCKNTVVLTDHKPCISIHTEPSLIKS